MGRKKTAMNSIKIKNGLSMFAISVVVLVLCIAIFCAGRNLAKKKADLDKRESYLLEQIEEENKRTLSIEEYARYTATKQYVEDVAKERLGLVYKDEIIFEAEN